MRKVLKLATLALLGVLLTHPAVVLSQAPYSSSRSRAEASQRELDRTLQNHLRKDPSSPQHHATPRASRIPVGNNLLSTDADKQRDVRQGDILEVKLSRELDLTLALTVSPEFEVEVPYVGKVNVVGRSVAQAIETIQNRLALFYQATPQFEKNTDTPASLIASEPVVDNVPDIDHLSTSRASSVTSPTETLTTEYKPDPQTTDPLEQALQRLIDSTSHLQPLVTEKSAKPPPAQPETTPIPVFEAPVEQLTASEPPPAILAQAEPVPAPLPPEPTVAPEPVTPTPPPTSPQDEDLLAFLDRIESSLLSASSPTSTTPSTPDVSPSVPTLAQEAQQPLPVEDLTARERWLTQEDSTTAPQPQDLPLIVHRETPRTEPVSPQASASDTLQPRDRIARTSPLVINNPNADRVLRTGDLIDIKMPNEPDLNLQARITRNGTIFLPYAGEVAIGGQSVTDAIGTIERALSQFYINPVVSINVTQSAPREFVMLGQVERPGVYEFAGTSESINLMEAIAKASGANRYGDLGRVTVKRNVNGRDTSISFDAQAMARGEEGANFEILPGDTIIVRLAKNDFSILGEVRFPGVYGLPPLQESIDLMEAIAMAGGPARFGDLGEIIVKRTVGQREQVLKVDAKSIGRNEKGANFQIYPGDSLIVRLARNDFVILGQIQRPGSYQIPPLQDNMDVLEALATAGGATRLANLNNVTVRRTINGEEKVFSVNLNEQARGRNVERFEIQPGDRIVISERMF